MYPLVVKSMGSFLPFRQSNTAEYTYIVTRHQRRSIRYKKTYRSRYQGHHCVWHLSFHDTLTIAMTWEEVIKTPCKGRHPSCEVGGMDHIDDPLVSVWLRALQEPVIYRYPDLKEH